LILQEMASTNSTTTSATTPEPQIKKLPEQQTNVEAHAPDATRFPKGTIGSWKNNLILEEQLLSRPCCTSLELMLMEQAMALCGKT
jgi:hypothetical protein